MQTKTKWLLILIVLGGFLLRVVSVSNLPSMLNRDEAALAYNAYLLKETGMDEWGRSWPLALESFGDYKLVGYPLLTIASFWLFGVTDFAVRLPSILAGTVLIGLTYWLLRILKQDQPVALLGALLVSLSPVFGFYSRMAFEANLALTVLVAAIAVLFFKVNRQPKAGSGQHKRLWLDMLATLLLLLASLVYNTPLLLLPFIALALVVYRGVKQPKGWIFPVSLLGIIFAVLLWQLLPLTSQKSAITIFSDPTVWSQFVAYRQALPNLLQPVLGNIYVYYSKIIGHHFLQSFSPQFLLFQGGSHPWHSLPNWGHIDWLTYLAALVGLATGVFKLIFTKGKQWVSLFILLLAGLAPAVVTVDAPHTTRSLLFLYLLLIFAALGYKQLATWMEGKLKSSYLAILIVLLVMLSSGLYWYDYFTAYPSQQISIYQTGFPAVLAEAGQHQAVNQQEPIYIVDPEGYQYIVAAWYDKISPREYFNTVERGQPDVIGFKYGQRAGRYRFVTNKNQTDTPLIYWDEDGQKWILEVN